MAIWQLTQDFIPDDIIHTKEIRSPLLTVVDINNNNEYSLPSVKPSVPSILEVFPDGTSQFIDASSIVGNPDALINILPLVIPTANTVPIFDGGNAFNTKSQSVLVVNNSSLTVNSDEPKINFNNTTYPTQLCKMAFESASQELIIEHHTPDDAKRNNIRLGTGDINIETSMGLISGNLNLNSNSGNLNLFSTSGNVSMATSNKSIILDEVNNILNINNTMGISPLTNITSPNIDVYTSAFKLRSQINLNQYSLPNPDNQPNTNDIILMSADGSSVFSGALTTVQTDVGTLQIQVSTNVLLPATIASLTTGNAWNTIFTISLTANKNYFINSVLFYNCSTATNGIDIQFIFSTSTPAAGNFNIKNILQIDNTTASDRSFVLTTTNSTILSFAGVNANAPAGQILSIASIGMVLSTVSQNMTIQFRRTNTGNAAIVSVYKNSYYNLLRNV